MLTLESIQTNLKVNSIIKNQPEIINSFLKDLTLPEIKLLISQLNKYQIIKIIFPSQIVADFVLESYKYKIASRHPQFNLKEYLLRVYNPLKTDELVEEAYEVPSHILEPYCAIKGRDNFVLNIDGKYTSKWIPTVDDFEEYEILNCKDQGAINFICEYILDPDSYYSFKQSQNKLQFLSENIFKSSRKNTLQAFVTGWF